MRSLVKDRGDALLAQAVPDRASEVGNERRRHNFVELAKQRKRQIPLLSPPSFVDVPEERLALGSRRLQPLRRGVGGGVEVLRQAAGALPLHGRHVAPVSLQRGAGLVVVVALILPF